MREIKIRLLDDSKVEDVDLYLASGTVRVSRTQLLNVLFEAFHNQIAGAAPTIEDIAAGICGAAELGLFRINQIRAGHGG